MKLSRRIIGMGMIAIGLAIFVTSHIPSVFALELNAEEIVSKDTSDALKLKDIDVRKQITSEAMRLALHEIEGIRTSLFKLNLEKESLEASLSGAFLKRLDI